MVAGLKKLDEIPTETPNPRRWILVLRNPFDREQPAIVRGYTSEYDALDQKDIYARRFPLAKTEILLIDEVINSGMEGVLDLAYEDGIGKHL